MKLSILMTTYNRPKELERALESIQNQVYENYEIILINDAGCDVSHTVWNLGMEGKTISITNDENIKPTACFNKALSFASGDLIIQLDDDDEFEVTGIDKMVRLFDLDESLSTVFAMATRIDTDGIQSFYPGSLYKYEPDQMLKRNWCVSCSRMIKTETLKKLGGFDESLGVLVDWDLNIKLMSYKYRILKTCVSIVHLSSNSWKRSHEELVKKEYEIIRSRYCQKSQ